MQQYIENIVIDKGTATLRNEEVKTANIPGGYNLGDNGKDDVKKQSSWFSTPIATSLLHFLTLFILGLLSWGLLWYAFGDGWRWDGPWFRLAIVAAVAWTSGQVLQTVTTLPPLLAALLIGISARNLNILDMRHFIHIDAFLRKVYPVVILGKASLGWDVYYMKKNWIQVTALGVLPWLAEVVTLATCTYLLLGFPWTWGFLLGSIYASVSCAVVMPSVARVGAKRNWAQLVCTAGGTDTALSVGVFGLVYTYMFFETEEVYRCVKAGLTLLVGVAIGVAWGTVAGTLPSSLDFYVSELRVLMVMVGGMFGNFCTSSIGWGGTGGVAVLACNATAATFWKNCGWKLNKNPASTAYRVFWAALEPTLFAYTGTFFVMNKRASDTMVQGFGILLICLTVRLAITFLVCWRMTLREKAFVCCTWIPKSIVEAVLCPVALSAILTSKNQDKHDREHAEDIITLIVQAILITTPVGYLLTNHLGPILLKEPEKDCESDPGPQRKSYNGSQSEDTKI